MRNQTLWARLQTVDLLNVDDLILPTSWLFGGKPLSDHVKLEIIEELRRFFYLLAVSNEALVPSHFVALALQCLRPLHMMMLSQAIGQCRIFLTPTRVRVALREGYRRTLELRAMEFGAVDPEHIWPQPFSMKLQLLGWAALAAGIAFGIAARYGFPTLAVSLILLLTGGFLWFTEGPWPRNLPFRKGFVAKLGA